MAAQSVYITRMIPDSAIAMLSAAGLSVSMNPHPRALRHEELIKEVGQHDAVICLVPDPIDRAVLKAATPRCKIFAACAVGYDNIDVDSARKVGIVVTNTPDVLTEATADLTWALLLSTARRLGEAERLVRAGAWRGWGMMDFLGADVFGKSLGIIGAGRIGTAMAKRARGFDMRVLYYDHSNKAPIESLGAGRTSLGELLESCDFISLHVSLNSETTHLLDGSAFDRIKPGAILINTSRGGVVDTAALIEALQTGRLAGAGLDVFEKEPAIPAALMELDNVVLLPHIGSATVSTRGKMANVAAANVLAVLNGQPPLNPVVPK